jgi:hypothetical protein
MEKEFQLNEDHLGEIEFLIATRAWEDFLVPFMTSLRGAGIMYLLNPSQERKDRVSDDVVRGRIQILDTVLGFPQLVAKWRENKAREDELAKDPDRIDERAAMGHHGPLG